MQAVNGVQSDSQAVSGVRVMVSGQVCQSDGQAVSVISEWWSVVKCVRVMVKQSVVSHSDGQAVNGVSFVLYGMRGILVLCGVHFVLMVCTYA